MVKRLAVAILLVSLVLFVSGCTTQTQTTEDTVILNTNNPTKVKFDDGTEFNFIIEDDGRLKMDYDVCSSWYTDRSGCGHNGFEYRVKKLKWITEGQIALYEILPVKEIAKSCTESCEFIFSKSLFLDGTVGDYEPRLIKIRVERDGEVIRFETDSFTLTFEDGKKVNLTENDEIEFGGFKYNITHKVVNYRTKYLVFQKMT